VSVRDVAVPKLQAAAGVPVTAPSAPVIAPIRIPDTTVIPPQPDSTPLIPKVPMMIMANFMPGPQRIIEVGYFEMLRCLLLETNNRAGHIVLREEWSTHSPQGGWWANNNPHTIVLHHFVGAPAQGQSLEQFMRNQESGHINRGMQAIGYHWAIAADGTIIQGRPENVLGEHTSGHNIGSIGISFIGNFENPGDMPTQAALDSAAWLIRDIQNRHAITAVYAHSQMSGHVGRGDFASNPTMLNWIGGF